MMILLDFLQICRQTKIVLANDIVKLFSDNYARNFLNYSVFKYCIYLCITCNFFLSMQGGKMAKYFLMCSRHLKFHM